MSAEKQLKESSGDLPGAAYFAIGAGAALLAKYMWSQLFSNESSSSSSGHALYETNKLLNE